MTRATKLQAFLIKFQFTKNLQAKFELFIIDFASSSSSSVIFIESTLSSSNFAV